MDDKLNWYKQGPTCTVAEAAKIMKRSKRSILRMCERQELINWKPGSTKILMYRRQVEEHINVKIDRAVNEYRLVQAEMTFFS